jgi:signal transduction histidine kinase
MKTQTNKKIVRNLKFCSRITGILVFLVGFLALLGWQFSVVYLKGVFPGLPIMAPNTAFAFFLGGTILFFAAEENDKTKKFAEIILYVLSGIIILIGISTLFEYFFGISLKVDALIFAKSQIQNVVRMSPQSAFNFLMVGASLLFIFSKNKDKVKIGQVLILVTGTISLISLFGFIYSISSFYTIAPYKGMAAHTALAFVLFFAGILFLKADEGFMEIFVSRGIRSLAARRLILTLFVIIIAEIVATIGRRTNFYDYSIEFFLHLIIITGAFVYLIFFAFRSLDTLGKMEMSLAKSKELDEAKTEFVGLASHQLRTPLTAVSWYAEMLLGKDFGDLNDKQIEYLKEIYAGNRRMIDLVDDLLNTSRIDMGTLKVKPESVNLVDVMNIKIAEFWSQVEQKHITVNKKFNQNLPNLMLDPELLGIVFQNIISNAVKYTPESGKIDIEIRRQNSHILVKIADNGYGIPESQQKKIFTKLFRADNVRKRDMEGTGLGMYIARSVVKKSGGKIWFESKENKGTTFYITF